MRSLVRLATLALSLALASPPPAAAGPVLDLALRGDDARLHGGGLNDFLSMGQGSGLIAADVDGDGIADLVVSSSGAEPIPGRRAAGEVRIALGPFRPGEVHDPIDGRAALTILGAEAGDSLGSALGIGDLDGDGIPDLAVGATGPDGLRGAVGVFFGPLPLGGDIIDLSVTQPGWRMDGEDPTDFLGYSLVIGDLDADGQDDLAIGIPHANGVGNARRDSGELRVIFGPLVRGDRVGVDAAPLVIRGDERQRIAWAGSEYGRYMAITDMDLDGRQDLVVGSPTSALSPGAPIEIRRGEVHVFFGPLAAGDIDVAVTRPDVLIRGPEGHSTIGGSLAAGDLDRDGAIDLAFHSNHNPVIAAGAVELLRGPFRRGDFVDMELRPADRTLLGAEEVDGLGVAIGLADLDADGSLDLVVGAYRDRSARPPDVPGLVHVVKGPLLPGPSMVLDAASADLTVLGYDPGDYFGFRLAIADVSGNGRPDLILGAPLGDRPNGLADASGSVHILFDDPGNRPPTCALSVPPHVECADAPPCGAAGRSVRLDGSASSDPDLDLVEHRWSVACPGGAQDLAGAIVDACLPFDCGSACDVMLTVIDARGNQASCSASVELLDDTPPALTVDPAAQVMLWAPNHRMHCFDVASWSPTVTDDCDPTPTWRFVGCASDQPDDDRGDGRTRPDCEVSADGSQVCVRAERSGVRGTRRVGLLAVAVDACGNESAPVEGGVVLIRHDQRRRGR